MTKRRSVLYGLVGAAVIGTRSARAEQEKRIGVLLATPETDEINQSLMQAFSKELNSLGWKVGETLKLDIYGTDGTPHDAELGASELLKKRPDLVVTQANTAFEAVWKKEKVVPIVFMGVGNPDGMGYVTSLAHPGGNATGFASLVDDSVAAKWLQYLLEIESGLTRLATSVLTPIRRNFTSFIEQAAATAKVSVIRVTYREIAGFESGLRTFASQGKGGLIIQPSPVMEANKQRVIKLVAELRLPAIYPFSYWTALGGLMSYGNDLTFVHRQAAHYVDRILKGEAAGELPVQLPTKQELVVNRRTASALGLTVPPSLLARADEVIE